jgi:hypothetical protein
MGQENYRGLYELVHVLCDGQPARHGLVLSKDVKNHKPLLPVSALFLSLNILGAFSTGLVGWYMASEVPPHFRGLVGWAAAVTAAALLGVGSIWVYLMRTIVKSHKEASVAH